MARTIAAAGALEAAIDWMVLLRSGEATPADTQRHRAWCAADERHAAAWAQVTGAVQATMAPLRTRGDGSRAAAQSALLCPPRRRAIRTVAGLALTGVAAAWLAQCQWPVATLLADLHTGTGERRSLTLVDGSRLVLNARTAVDIEFGGDRRVLRLRAGEVIVQVAPDAQRPFSVVTAEGSVQALGTRYLVRQEEGRTLALVLQHSVLVRPAAGAARMLPEGNSAWFDADAVAAHQSGGSAAAAWEHGMLVARDQPLSDVVALLRPYRGGFIRVSAAAAQLRVLGTFRLDDSDRMLESLAQTLPIRLTHYGPWLVAIDIRT